MHFNENFGREQVIMKSGKEQMRLVIYKQKPGECTPKIVPIPPTFSKTNPCMNLYLIQPITLTEYAKELILKAAEICSCEDAKPTLPHTPPPLASAYEHPDKNLIPCFHNINIGLII